MIIDELKRQGGSAENGQNVSALREDVQALQREIARLSELVAAKSLTPALTMREPAPPLPATRPVQRAVATEPVEWRAPTRGKLLSKVYAVADLVVPVPDVYPKSAERNPVPREPARPEFDALLNLLTSAIEPDSWEQRGGPGTVHPLEKNLSLVVSQTEAVHGKLAELLEKLRWLQDHAVELEIMFVSATPAAVEEAGLDLSEKGRLLAPEQAKRVRAAFSGEKDTQITAAPRVTLFNKQLCELQTALPEDRRLHLILHGAIGEDLHTVRLNLAVNPRDTADAVRSGVSIAIPSGETFVLDVTDRLAGGRETGVPLLSKVPHLDRLFKNVRPAASERTLLLITSRVRIDAEAVQP